MMIAVSLGDLDGRRSSFLFIKLSLIMMRHAEMIRADVIMSRILPRCVFAVISWMLEPNTRFPSAATVMKGQTCVCVCVLCNSVVLRSHSYMCS